MRTFFPRRLAAAFLAAAAATVGLVAVAPAARAAAAFDTSAAVASLGRLLPNQASQITLVAASQATPGVDSFTVSGSTGAITVQGTSPATLLAGVGWYLRNVARVDIGFPGTSTSQLPATLPAVTAPFTDSAVVPHRYALNDTDNGYSGAYRSFADYQHEIDVLALHGINEVYVTVGAEKPYYDAMQQFGYSATDMQNWIPAPSHQPWWLLQNMYGYGGPISGQLVTARAATGRQVCDQLRSLGMTPVLPGYYGTVPTDFATRNPGTNVVAQGTWVGFTRDSWLDPNDPIYPKVAAAYYAAQATAFGNSTMYKMDPLHEGGTAGNVNVTSAATAIQTALLTAHPGATWVILGWTSNPTTAVLNGVDKTKMLVVDGVSDRYDNLDRETSWGNTPYAFGTIPDFGGKSTFGSNSAVWVSRFYQWLTKTGSMERGIAYMPEGTGTDPASFALFSDLAWSGGINQGTWFQNYSTARYGGTDPNAAAAWDQLRQGPYSMPSGTWSEPQDGLFTARPSLTANTTGTWSPTSMRYNAATVQTALNDLLNVSTSLRGSDAYKFDLVNTARQALANRSRALLPAINNAYNAKDLTTFRSLVAEWNKDEASLDQLAATDTRFLTGTWLGNVASWGASTAEQNQLQYDARSIITTWGDRTEADTNGLRDYAAREYSGIVNDLYAKRWAAYFSSLDTALVNNTTPAAIDFFAMDDAWAHSTTTYPTTTTGDPYTVAAAVAAALPPVSPVTSGSTYKVVNANSGKALDDPGFSTAAGTQLDQWTLNGGTNQNWKVTQNQNGSYTLVNGASGLCLDVTGGSSTPGTAIEQWTCNGGSNQQFTLTASGAGYALVAQNSGECVDVSGGSVADGAKIIEWTCTGNANQRWSFQP